MAKESQNTKKYKDTPLYSIYGARDSKDGKRVNVTLITGKDDNKDYAAISFKKDSDKVVIKKDFLWIKVKFLENKTDKKVEEDDLPY